MAAMLKAGDPAPDFKAAATDGRPVSLSALRGRPVVVYFFPKAFTPGCTLETRAFRDAYPELSALGVEVIGVSADSNERQCEFAAAEKVSFPMVGDSSRELGKAFDALWPLLNVNQRITYVIDEKGRIEAVFHHELQIGKHLARVREHLAARKPAV